MSCGTPLASHFKVTDEFMFTDLFWGLGVKEGADLDVVTENERLSQTKH